MKAARTVLFFLAVTAFDVKWANEMILKHPLHPETANAAEPSRRIVFLGDSLTAGFGLEPEESFPSIIAERASALPGSFKFVNAGISGDTTAGGLGRVDWLLREKVDILIIALGANDGFRGISPETAKSNIVGIIRKTRKRHPNAVILLARMLFPPNLGAEYTDRFENIYPEISREEDVTLLPFILDGVAGLANLNQSDGIHPTAEGQRILADNVWRVLKPLLENPQ